MAKEHGSLETKDTRVHGADDLVMQTWKIPARDLKQHLIESVGLKNANDTAFFALLLFCRKHTRIILNFIHVICFMESG